MLGDRRYALYQIDIRTLIWALDRMCVPGAGRFTVQKVINRLELAYKQEPYARSQLEVAGRKHLGLLLALNTLCTDKTVIPHEFWHGEGCIPNPRIGPEMDYRQYYETHKDAVISALVSTIECMPLGTVFTVLDLVRKAPIPYLLVPEMQKKSCCLAGSVCRQYQRAGYLVTGSFKRKQLEFIRTDYNIH
ncbi:MAG: hypothetical protein BGO55_08545 [Sphingobacteriales bacterium 50-39]|nr:MAG: hypothetical protein BGO55_08545 [Sphingobacteriales bacterium 50-39]